MDSNVLRHISALEERYPQLSVCNDAIKGAYEIMEQAYANGRKLLVCGNGGSAADAEHVAGELLNKFRKHRPVPAALAAALPAELASRLEGALPAVSLVSMSGAISAIANDIDWSLAFAQQTLALGRKGDALLAISTSGNSANCVAAAQVAKAAGMRTVALTGAAESALSRLCDVAVRVPERETFRIQELHLPVYHALCAALEEEFFQS